MEATLAAAQKAIAKFGGALRQFVLDDKGAVVIWTFGLPGSTYEDNARRALQSGFAMVSALKALGLSPRVGVTSGRTFCGLVGAPHRCEYAVMGPCVNLAARLMCACAKHDTRVLCNDELRDRVLLYYDNLWNYHRATSAETDIGFIRSLSDPLRLDLMMSLYSDMLARVTFLRDVDACVLEEVVLRLAPKIFMEGDMVTHLGERGAWMGLIGRGMCAVLSPTSREDART